MASYRKNIKHTQPVIRKSPAQPVVSVTSARTALKEKPKFNFTSNKYFIPAILFICCFILYGNTLNNGYAFNDPIYTTQNTFITNGFSSIKDIFDKDSDYGYNKVNASLYRPLTLLSFMTEVSLFGFQPHLSHFINLVLFALTIVLLYLLLQKILKNYHPGIILAATLLFAFHPIHTEVVANIKSRDEILSLLLGITSFYFMFLFVEKNRNGYYIYSMVTFFIALFCKESALTFVAIIPLLLYFFTDLPLKKIIFTSLPYFVLSMVYFGIRLMVIKSVTITSPIGVTDNALMAADSQADRIATSFVLLGKYIYMTIIPYPLSWDYTYNQIPIVSWGNIKPILSVIISAALIIYMILGFKRKSIYSFLIALFFITIFLSSNLVIRIAWTFGERFLYIPSLAFCIALPVLLARIVKLKPLKVDSNSIPNQRLLLPIKSNAFYWTTGCILFVYAIILIPRNRVWKNDYTLFLSGTETSPNSLRTHAALGSVYKDSAKKNGDPAKKMQYYSLAVQEFKKSTEIYPNYTEGFYFTGQCYYFEGKEDSAIPYYKRTLELNPKYSGAAYNLGVIYFNHTQYENAIPYFNMEIQTDSSLDAMANLGASYQFEGNYPLAFHYDSLVLKKDPNSKQTRSNVVFMHNSLATQYLNSNELDKALNEFYIDSKYDSASADLYGNIGAIYSRKGNIEMAKVYFQKAIQKDPKNESFKKSLYLLNGGH